MLFLFIPQVRSEAGTDTWFLFSVFLVTDPVSLSLLPDPSLSFSTPIYVFTQYTSVSVQWTLTNETTGISNKTWVDGCSDVSL